MRMRSWKAVVGPPALALLLVGCGDTPAPDPSEDGSSDAGAAATEQSEQPPHPERPPQPERPGVRFDPATARPGDSVGVLVVDTIVAGPTVVDSTLVGMARFRGRIELGGRMVPHPDDDLRGESVCFEADEESAARLPRWLHDERRAWFCFSNPADAVAALGRAAGAAGDPGVTVVIDQFTIHRGLSDEVNSARFVAPGETEPPGR